MELFLSFANAVMPYNTSRISLTISNKDIDKLGYRAGIPRISKGAKTKIIEHIQHLVVDIMFYLRPLLDKHADERLSVQTIINNIYGINFLIP